MERRLVVEGLVAKTDFFMGGGGAGGASGRLRSVAWSSPSDSWSKSGGVGRALEKRERPARGTWSEDISILPYRLYVLADKG